MKMVDWFENNKKKCDLLRDALVLMREIDLAEKGGKGVIRRSADKFRGKLLEEIDTLLRDLEQAA